MPPQTAIHAAICVRHLTAKSNTDFDDIDRGFRTGQGNVHLAQAAQASALARTLPTVLSVSRTQNVDIMLRSVSGTMEQKAEACTFMLRQILAASPSHISNALLALKYILLSTANDNQQVCSTPALEMQHAKLIFGQHRRAPEVALTVPLRECRQARSW